VIKKPHERGGHSPRWAAVPEKIIIIITLILCSNNESIENKFPPKIRKESDAVWHLTFNKNKRNEIVIKVVQNGLTSLFHHIP
jgi:hypothetical protein